MKPKKFLFTVLVCLMAGTAFLAACGEAPADPSPQPQPKPTYAVTYSLGECEGSAYAGESALPTETEKEEGAQFALAAVPEWEGYTFQGWNDGTATLDAGVQYTMPAHAVTFTAQWEKEEPEPEPKPTYAVTYSLGECEGVAYAGGSVLPTEAEKKEGEKFALAAAPEWEGYTFQGWNDGASALKAGVQYTMPAHAVTFTAQWEKEEPEPEPKPEPKPDLPDGYVKDTNVTVPGWSENATEGGYEIGKGQYVKLTATLTSKETGDSAYGIPAKIFPNSARDNNNFYQFRCDFAVKRVNWSWNENNDGFTVSDGGWNREAYRACTAGSVEITVALSEEGVFTYTFSFAADGYSHDRVFTDNVKMDSAVVLFGLDHSSAEDVTVEYPMNGALTLTLDQGEGAAETYHFSKGDAYTFGTDPFRSGYLFLGWQKEGEGTYYKQGDQFLVTESAAFVAAWVQKPKATIDKDGGTGTVYEPKMTYDPETGKFAVGLPTVQSSFKKPGFALKGWEITVNGVSSEGELSVEAGAQIVFKAIWATPYAVTYSLGECEGTAYGGNTRKPTEASKAEGVTFTLAKAPEWAGYTFKGWSDGASTLEAGAQYTMPAHDVTLTATWEKLPHYAVTFLAGSCNGVPYAGQTLIDAQDDLYEGAVFPLARALEWAGYTFKGWNDGSETYAALYRYTMPAHAVTFTAVWEKLPTHTVTYLPGADGVLNMPQSGEYFEGQTVMTLPIRAGYTFLGWSKGEKVYRAGDAFDFTEENVTLTATWEQLSQENAQIFVLSGVWKMTTEDGDTYLQISGTEGAWDAFKAIGSYKVGSIEIKSITETSIKFTIHADRPAGSGTNNIGCTYNFATDTIDAGIYGSYTRETQKPQATVSTLPAVLPVTKKH